MSSNADSVEVKLLDLGLKEDEYETKVYLASKARKQLQKFLEKQDPHRLFAQALRRIAGQGASYFVNSVVRAEGSGAYAIGIRKHVFRLAGFFSRNDMQEFIGTGTYEKSGPGNKRGQSGDEICREAARIKESGNWKIS